MRFVPSLILIFILLLTSSISTEILAQEKAPRQKITIQFENKKQKSKELRVDEILKSLPNKTLTIFDIYNNNIETTFTGVDLSEFIKKYGTPNYKVVRINSIDGYMANVDRKTIEDLKLFMAIKDTRGFLTVDNMGPARLISELKGKMNQDQQIKIGFYWVWQLKTITLLE